MGTAFLTALIIETLRSPASAARRLIDARLETHVLWLALVLVTVLNAISFYLSNAVVPQSGTGPVTGLTQNPVLYAMMSGGALMIIVFILTWVGRALGGTARVADILVLMVWLQFIGLVLQIAVLVLLLAMPALAVLMSLGALVLSLWLTLNFVSVAHGFDSLLRAFAVVVLSGLGMIISLSVILAILGVNAEGMTGNV